MSARLPHPEEAKTAKEKNPAAVALGLLGGHKGGTATAKNRTPAERSEADSSRGPSAMGEGGY